MKYLSLIRAGRVVLPCIIVLLVSSTELAARGGAGVPSEPGNPAEPTGEAHGAKQPGVAPQPKEDQQDNQLYIDDQKPGYENELEESKSEFFGVSGEEN
ncbi:MAG: hypothetical protein WBD00_05000 [Candidatus Omnitrophota bacterium]